MELIPVNLFVSYAFTITGRKIVYRIPDMAYGQWVIYHYNYPKYYFDSFDKVYQPYIDPLKGKKLGIYNFLKKKLKKADLTLSLTMSFWGIVTVSRPGSKEFFLEKLPVNLFE